ncbi:hypothetical protein Tsp_12005, partial [Trichinella spiralis]
MFLATAFLPVREIDTSARLLETGTTGCDGHPDSAYAIRKRYRW